MSTEQLSAEGYPQHAREGQQVGWCTTGPPATKEAPSCLFTSDASTQGSPGPRSVIAIDCEMVLTNLGDELVSLVAVDAQLEVMPDLNPRVLT